MFSTSSSKLSLWHKIFSLKLLLPEARLIARLFEGGLPYDGAVALTVS